MMKQWPIRRAVRMPDCRDTTPLISSSVCRLPFISASTLPAVTSSTALAAESSLCSEFTSSIALMSIFDCAATDRTRSTGPTRMGSTNRKFVASTTPRNDTSSHGCATATLIVVSFWAAAIRRSYLSCETEVVRVAASDISDLSASAWLKLRAEKLLDPRPAALTLPVQRAGRRDELAHRVPRRGDVVLAAPEELRHGLDRALLVELNELQLDVQHFPELRSRGAVVRLPLLSDALEHTEAALVEGALRQSHVDERPQRRFLEAALLELPLEARPEFAGAPLAHEIALDAARSLFRLSPDHGLQ